MLVFIALLFCFGQATAQVSFSTTTLPTGMDFTPGGTGLVQTPDINNDGFPEMIYTTALGGAITYLQNNGGGSFSTPSPNPFASYTAGSPSGTVFNQSASIADYDGDGDLDIWVRVNGAANDVYLRNDAGTYVTGTVFPGMEFTLPNTANVQVADINLDGLPDIVYNTAAGGAITYLQNDGGSSFSTPVSNPFSAYTGSSPAGTNTLLSACDFADFDGDGDVDIWVRVSGVANDVYLQNNSGTYGAAALITGMEFSGAGIGAVKVGDMNGDGLPDILYNTGAATAMVYLQNNNGTSFSTPAPNPFAAYTGSTPAGVTLNTAATVLDIDGDGDMDLWVRVGGAANDFFTTASGSAPRFVATVPAHQAASISVNTDIELSFTENVFAGTGSFQIRRLDDNSIVESIPANGANVSGSGTATIAIDPVASLASGTSYYITFDRTALADAQGLIAGHIDAALKTRVPERTANFLQFTTSGTLPVTLVSFSAQMDAGKVLLKWETASEWNARDFTVQYSTDGRDWNEIAIIPAVGNSTLIRQYQYTHNSPADGNNYYRLLQTDADGKEHLSGVRIVRQTVPGEISLYPNPAKGTAWLKTNHTGLQQVTIYDAVGRRICYFSHSGDLIRLPVEKLTAGLYHVVITNDKGNISRTLVVE